VYFNDPIYKLKLKTNMKRVNVKIIKLLANSLVMFLTIVLNNSFAQGRFLLVGGGNEKETSLSWSTPAYKWAASGKRVAIISTSGSEYPQYFVNWCGATSAKNFIIADRDAANQPSLYDSLLSYQMIFFAGGDQWDYYSQYKNTKLMEAIISLFSSGGTIGGTSAGMQILSEIVFTAENGTVYPDECIIDPKNKYIKLANDLFEFFPGLVFDTHLAERGRLPRLVSFVANKALTENRKIVGLGLDDMTCLAIDETYLATVYGTGAATLVLSEPRNYSQNSNRLIADSVVITQLLEGCQIDMKTMELNTQPLSLPVSPKLKGENGAYTFLAGGEGANGNNAPILDFWAKLTAPSQSTLIVTKELNSYIAELKSEVDQLTGKTSQIIVASSSNGTSATVLSQILSCGRIIFSENDENLVSGFLTSPNGQSLLNQIKSQNIPIAFLGSDARLAGKVVVTNLETEYASYDGKMAILPGMSLLSNTVIIPETFRNSDYYENTITALPFAMIHDSLQYGIWLTGDNFIFYSTKGNKAILEARGKAPILLMTNKNGMEAGMSTKTATGSSSAKPRQVGGFTKMIFTSFDESNPIILGTGVALESIPNQKTNLSISVNGDQLSISGIEMPFNYRFIQINGYTISEGISNTPYITIPRNTLSSPQVLLLNVSNKSINQTIKFSVNL